MQSHKNVVFTTGGEVVPGATVYVYNVGTVVPATIYSDNGVTAKTQPFTTDNEGEYVFWAADGVYDIHITYGSATEDYQIVLFDPIRGGSSTDVSIGPIASPALFLDVSANDLQIGRDLTTETAQINLGAGRTGDGVSKIDLIGDATYTDYGVRLRRDTGGANAISSVDHRGTGGLYINAVDAGSVILKTNNTTALTVSSIQDISIGTTCAFFDVSANQLQIGRNLTTETAEISIGQGRTGNGVSKIDFIGDTTYTDYSLRLRRDSTGANAETALDHRGTGALLIKARDAGSIQLQTNNTTALTVDASRNIKIGATTTMGTSAEKALGIDIGTEPTTSPAGMIQVYAKDSSDGTTNATLAFRTEQAVEAIGTFTPSHKHKIWLNGVEYWIQLDAV